MPRVGDIIHVAEQRRLAFGTLTRIFTPGDKAFRLRDLRNAFNCDYCTHVCQVGYSARRGGFIIKDTKAKGLVDNVISYYQKAANQRILAIYRPREYDNRFARQAFCLRLEDELAAAQKQREKYGYNYGGLREDYVPDFLLPLFPVLAALKNDPLLRYCSERVQDDWRKDGGRYLDDTAFSPADSLVLCEALGLEDVSSEYEGL
jgi:hypothetical protein